MKKIELEPWTVKVTKAENGFVVTRRCYIDDTKEGVPIYREEHIVCEDMIGMLYTVADEFGEGYDKYNKENLNIDMSKKGHRYSE